MIDAGPVGDVGDTATAGVGSDGAAPGDTASRSRASAAVIMLTDSRFPSGGHAYSAGMEQAVTWGDVVDLVTAEAFAIGRAATSSMAAAQVAAAATVVATASSDLATTGDLLDGLDAELDARMASSAARQVSRQQGRRWLRAVRAVWPEPLAQLSRPGPTGRDVLDDRHGWVVMGAATGLLGVGPVDAATVALYDLAGTPMWAAVRLLGLDPVATAGVVARLVAGYEPSVRRLAVTAARETALRLSASGQPIDWSWISWSTAPMSDLAAEAHLRREERLFAS
jgi:urease accessory protein